MKTCIFGPKTVKAFSVKFHHFWNLYDGCDAVDVRVRETWVQALAPPLSASSSLGRLLNYLSLGSLFAKKISNIYFINCED